MITIGVDTHKCVHAAVAVDDAGCEVGRWRGPNARAAWDELHHWAAQHGDDRQWGIEGAGGYGRGLAQRLIHLGETVFEVNSRWTASGRRRARKGEKNDALDATAVARTVKQEGSALPRVLADDESTILMVLTTERDELVRESTRIRSQIKALAVARFPSLTRLCGVNALTAGILAGLLGPGQRFATDAQLAAYAGVAPLEASSGMRIRHRLSRSGNRRLNSVIYWIVLTQAHHSPEARAYLARRMSQGKTRREAHRALRRYIARALWRLWVECHSPAVPMLVPAAA